MCGIFVAVKTEGEFSSETFQTFVGLTDVVRFRGPDDAGYVRLNVKGRRVQRGSFDVFLGSRRLAILDLSANGHQPMTDGEGRWIVFNGEIFNYLELRRELQTLGHRFRTETDTEVILRLYAEYGSKGFNKLNGMWAFAIADLRRGHVVLSRDRFSIKPLHILRQEGALYFASEIKQLLPLMPQTKPNLETLGIFLSQGLLDYSRDTFFAGISRVPPRSNLIVSMHSGKVVEEVYWDFSPAETPLKMDDAVVGFRELFLDAIKIRLRSDVQVSVLLSGGLDSSSVAVATRLHGSSPLDTYSVVSNDPRYSEDRFIDVLARSGIKNRKIPFTSSDVINDLDRAIYHNDEPFNGLSVLAQYRLLATIKRESDTTVLLSGQGADEVLLGYKKFFYFYLQTLLTQRKYSDAIWQILMSIVKRTVIHQFRWREAKRYIKRPNKRSERVFLSCRNRIPVWKCDDLRTRQIADIESYSVPALAHYEDRNAMAHSLEVRHPFLDHRIVDFVVNLPVEQKIRNGWTKYLLRQSLPELPEAIRWRRDKQPFMTPEEAWLKIDLRPLIEHLFHKSRLGEMGVLDPQAFIAHYDDFRNGRSISPVEIGRTTVAEMWARQAFGSSV